MLAELQSSYGGQELEISTTKKRGRPSGQKNAQVGTTPDVLKKWIASKKKSFISVNTIVNNDKNNSPSSLSSSINKDQYDVSDKDDILDKDCNDKDKEEDSNRQEGTKDIIATTSKAAHYHNANNTVYDNNTTEKNINELSASAALDDVVLDDYRLCHNIAVGTMNRSDKIHKGH
ncbi:hypothetical protein BDC45DRAFT_603899, partial [Circinella umbellata]